MTSKIRALAVQETKTVIVTKGLSKIYPNGAQALKDVNLSVRPDDFIVIIGRSGAGKTTLLRCFNRLIQPTEGRIILKGEDITSITGRSLQQVRSKMGMIFQQFNLVRRLTVIENVLVGRFHFQKSAVRWVGSLLRCFGREDKDIAFECLKEVGIGDLAFQRCERLSGGQQQRVAIARALAQQPEIILADEPIASLDPRSADKVMDLLSAIHEKQGIPVIVNLHHIDYAKRYGKRVIGMAGGRIVFKGYADDLSREVIERVYAGADEEEMDQLVACA